MWLSTEELNRIDELIRIGLPKSNNSSIFGCTVATPSSGSYDDIYDNASFVPLDIYDNNPSSPTTPLNFYSGSYLMPSSGAAIQPSLNQKTHYSFNVSIGKPTLNKIVINCIENSRGDVIYFSKNPDVILKAAEKFNESYDPATKSKIILAGSKQNYVNIQLSFSKFAFDGMVLTVEFENYKVVDSKGVFDYPKCISETCSFFLEGEAYLNEDETEIVEVSINSLNYINIFRFDTVERVTYIH